MSKYKKSDISHLNSFVKQFGNDVIKYKYAPITYVEIEKSFFAFITLLSTIADLFYLKILCVGLTFS